MKRPSKEIIFAAIVCIAVIIWANTCLAGDCKATTKKGIACKMHTTEKAEYCRIHDPAIARCNQITSANKPCRNTVTLTGDTCHLHKKGGSK